MFWAVLALAALVSLLGVAGLWRLAHARGWLRSADQVGGSCGPTPAAGWVLALGLGGLAALVLLTLAKAWQRDRVLSLDSWAAEMARQAWSPVIAPLVRGVTHLADPLTLWLASGCVVLLLWRLREPALGLVWIAAVGGNALLNPALKGVFQRLRPEADLSGLVASGYSYPSGHTSAAVVAFGMGAYLAWRLLPQRWHLPASLLAVLGAVAVGASRVYLQAHYLSDVLAGLATGSAWLALVIAAAGAWRVRQVGRNSLL